MIMVANYRSMLVIRNKEHLGNIDFFLNDEPIKLCDVQIILFISWTKFKLSKYDTPNEKMAKTK